MCAIKKNQIQYNGCVHINDDGIHVHMHLGSSCIDSNRRLVAIRFELFNEIVSRYVRDDERDTNACLHHYFQYSIV